MAFVPNYLSQRDPRWVDENLGFDDTMTIGSDGCALTCLAMLVNGYGYNETPLSINKVLKEMGPGNGYLGTLVIWGSLTIAFPKIVFRRMVICRDEPAPLESINTSIELGQAVIVEVDYSPSSGLQNHWVVLYGRKSGDYLMLDPWPYPSDTEEVLLSERYGHGRDLEQVISAAVWYESISLVPPSTDDRLYVRVLTNVAAGLRLRSAPTTASDTLSIEPAGALLHCLEPNASVLSKIGVMDQWLRVSNITNLEGYIAAWYVEKVEPAPPIQPPIEPVPTPPPEPEPPTTSMDVYVSLSVGNSGLRLRSQPSLAGNLVTIINAGKKLGVLESEEQARAKIGTRDEWLSVRDEKGYTGYVAAWLVGEESAAPTPQPEPITHTMIVRVSSRVSKEGLRVHANPNESSRLISIVKAGVELDVLEPEEQARPKIGNQNEWLYIRDSRGAAGYVAAWLIEADTSPQDSETQPEPATPTMKVYVSSRVSGEGLRIRTKPSTSGRLVATEKVGVGLDVLEPAEQARPKIGVQNEWLNVRDEQGYSGYAAAWLVEEEISAQESESQPEPISPSMKVLVSSNVSKEGLRIRAKPNTSSRLVAIVKPGEELGVLEPEEQARPKIGRKHQWLNVRDKRGFIGYAAAWLVEEEPTAPTSQKEQDSLVMKVSLANNVSSEGLRIRAKPSVASKLVAIVKEDEELIVLEPQEQALQKIGVIDQWLHVQNEKGNTGYVAAWLVESNLPDAKPSTADEEMLGDADSSTSATLMSVIVSGSTGSGGLRLREQPNTNSNTKKVLLAGAILQVLEPAESASAKVGVSGKWLHIRDADGEEGYVAAWFVREQ